MALVVENGFGKSESSALFDVFVGICLQALLNGFPVDAQIVGDWFASECQPRFIARRAARVLDRLFEVMRALQVFPAWRTLGGVD